MPILRVTDPADPRLRDYRDLTDVALRRVREPEEGLYIAESAKVIARAIAAGHRPRSVLVQQKWLAEVEALLAGDVEVPILLVEDAVAEAVTGYAVHRGALAAMTRPAPVDPRALLSAARRVVVLEDIVDHTNVGAIFRSAAGLGADAVLVSARCADPLYRRSVRVSMGTVFQVPWARLPEWRRRGPCSGRRGSRWPLWPCARMRSLWTTSPPRRRRASPWRSGPRGTDCRPTRSMRRTRSCASRWPGSGFPQRRRRERGHPVGAASSSVSGFVARTTGNGSGRLAWTVSPEDC